MIDLESDIYSYVEDIIKTAHSNVFVSSQYVQTPDKLPAVTIVEADNRVRQDMSSSSGIENAVSVMYEVNVYSNKSSGKKLQAKQIAETVDNAFTEIGLVRTLREQIPNMKDATIFRIVCRYEGSIDKDFWIYQD